MDWQCIKDLIQLMEKFSLHKLSIKERGVEIFLERSCSHNIRQAVEEEGQQDCSYSRSKGNYGQLFYVKSPIVGRFHRFPFVSEEKGHGGPFVRVNQRVERGQILCFIESMKMLYEVKSPFKGLIHSIFPHHEDLVEYGQILFSIES